MIIVIQDRKIFIELVGKTTEIVLEYITHWNKNKIIIKKKIKSRLWEISYVHFGEIKILIHFGRLDLFNKRI